MPFTDQVTHSETITHPSANEEPESLQRRQGNYSDVTLRFYQEFGIIGQVTPATETTEVFTVGRGERHDPLPEYHEIEHELPPTYHEAVGGSGVEVRIENERY